MTPRKRFIRIVARGSLIAGVLFLLLIRPLSINGTKNHAKEFG